MLFLFLVFLIAAAVFVLRSYNAMRQNMENLKESLSNISVVTSKKISLVNQLIQIVQNYQESEKFVMLQVSSDTVQSMQDASARSGAVIADIGRYAQKFPELKSNQQYGRLMDALHVSEQEVQQARVHYNYNAKVFNTARTSIPTVFYASALGFGEAQYLSIGTAEDPAMKVQQPMVSDDANRVNELLGKAGRRTLESARQLGQQGWAAAEKGAASFQKTGGEVKAETKAASFCPKCGAPHEAAGSFCGDCGHRF